MASGWPWLMTNRSTVFPRVETTVGRSDAQELLEGAQEAAGLKLRGFELEDSPRAVIARLGVTPGTFLRLLRVSL